MKAFNIIAGGVLIVSALGGMLISSCTQYYYRPNMETVPLLTKKGDLSLNGGLILSNSSGGAAVQGGYALSENVSVAGAASWISGDEGNSGWIAEGAVGAYSTILNNWVLEGYTGIGYAYLRRNDTLGQNVFSLNAIRSFIQPNFGFRSRFLEAAVSLRLSMVNYSNVTRGNSPEASNSNFNELDTLPKYSHYFIEPGFTLRVGFEQIKLELQYVYSSKLDADMLSFEPATIWLGVNVRF